eukprot:gene952-916_t
MQEILSIVQLFIELAVLVACYYGAKNLITNFPKDLKSKKQKGTNEAVDGDQKPRPQIATEIDESLICSPYINNLDCHDDEVSIAFGEDAECFNERSFLTEEQRVQQENLPVQTDRLPEQIRAASQGRPVDCQTRSLTKIPSADSLTIEQYRMSRLVSPVTDDSFFWESST